MVSIRDEYAPRFGRQVLTLWSPPFASTYEGEAVELPRHDGYMVTAFDGHTRVRVTCEAPRTDENWMRVDDALAEAYETAIRAAGYTTLDVS